MLGSGATVVGALPPCHVEGEIQRSRLGQAIQAPADKDRCASNPSRSRVTVASAAARLPSVPVTGAEEVPTTCPNTSGHSQHIPDTGYRVITEVFLCEVSRGSRFRQAVPGQQVVTVRGSVTVRTWARPRVGFHADREHHVNWGIGHREASDNLPPWIPSHQEVTLCSWEGATGTALKAWGRVGAVTSHPPVTRILTICYGQVCCC